MIRSSIGWIAWLVNIILLVAVLVIVANRPVPIENNYVSFSIERATIHVKEGGEFIARCDTPPKVVDLRGRERKGKELCK